MMKLKDYFENARGIGVLATSDRKGRVNAAVYARPHFFGAQKAVFIMGDRLTRKNLGENPLAVYLFIKSGTKSEGKRLYLKKTGEEKNAMLIKKLRRKADSRTPEKSGRESKFLVYFQVEKVLSLTGVARVREKQKRR